MKYRKFIVFFLSATLAWAGLTASAGALPADRTSMASPASEVRRPAAIWERPAL